MYEDVILNTSIWDYIEGQETRDLYKDIFTKLRRKKTELVIPFRCDTPTVIRQMELTLRSGPEKTIEMEGRLLDKKHREAVSLFDLKAERSDETIEICSICRKLHIRAGEWLDVEHAIVQKRLFTKKQMPRLIEKICPACENIMRNAANDRQNK